MRWLVTGGCGFIGRNLARHLLDGGHAIRVLDNLTVGRCEDLGYAGPFRERPLAALDGIWPEAAIDLVVADVTAPSSTLAAAAGADIIVHLAANTGVERSISDPRAD